ncbi:MAG: undecaprenyl diphosphate synthase family protein [Flavobacteriales bacterium]|nr:undecaprenyl diphosphate synthase family protein [Flavobacteriales bacterium]
MRFPKHIGIIPDGNRRWAQSNGMAKEQGYMPGVDMGHSFFKQCQQSGVEEVTYYGFTTDNTKRPTVQYQAFSEACIVAVTILSGEDAELLVMGNTESPMFPKKLLPFITRQVFGKGGLKVNFLINYSWEWDLNLLKTANASAKGISRHIHSAEISRIDLIIRWGGRRRLSGFLPVQSIYSDFFVIDDYWPDYKPEHFWQAIHWYNEQDITLGG